MDTNNLWVTLKDIVDGSGYDECEEPVLPVLPVLNGRIYVRENDVAHFIGNALLSDYYDELIHANEKQSTRCLDRCKNATFTITSEEGNLRGLHDILMDLPDCRNMDGRDIEEYETWME